MFIAAISAIFDNERNISKWCVFTSVASRLLWTELEEYLAGNGLQLPRGTGNRYAAYG